MPQPTNSTLMRDIHPMLHNEHVNVKAFGAVGDGVTDDRAAIQAAIDAAGAVGQGTVFLPAADYIISSPLTINGDYGSVRLVGASGRPADTYPFGIGSGSRIIGAINGRLIERTNTTSNVAVSIENLALWNTHNTGTCIGLGGIQAPSRVVGCSLYGHNGYVALENSFQYSVENCWVHAYGASNGTGINVGGHSMIKQCDVVGYGTGYGVTAAGTGVAIIGGRYEVNGTGILLFDGFQGFVGGIRMEANDYGMDITALYSGSTILSGIHLYGTVGSPSGGGITGFNIREVWGLSMIGCGATGYTNDFRVDNTANRHNVSLISCSGGTWSLPADKHDLTIIDCEGVDDIVRAPVIARASLPAAGTGEDGRLIIDDNGAGDRNLMIYAGGQRFRIDGGANV